MATKKDEGYNDQVHMYRIKREWRWRRVAPNGKIVGASSESFKTLQACRTNFYRQCLYIDANSEITTIDGVSI